MALVVQKYGGTSVGDVERIANVARRIGGYRQRGDSVVVVVSAMSGETNRRIRRSDPVRLSLPQRDDDVIGNVYQKSTVANPAAPKATIAVVPVSLRTRS